jgi:hypothetical protein
MKLWEALDEQSKVVLLTPQGAESFLLAFAPEQRAVLGQATAKALDSEVADDCTPEQAMTVFTSLVADDLVAQGVAVRTVAQGTADKPVLPS